jgi:hypothetical protein
MKKILLFFMFVMMPAATFARCNGGAIATDFWGVKHGCDCNNGDVDQHDPMGTEILSATPGRKLVCQRSGNPFKRDGWKEVSGGFCSDSPTLETSHNILMMMITGSQNTKITAPDGLQTVMDETRRCWRVQCPAGSYFQGDLEGKVDYSKCVSCTGTSNASDGICWNIQCGSGNDTENAATRNKKFGSEVVVYDGKCMPVCDVTAVGTVAVASSDSDSDKTYMKVKIDNQSSNSLGITTKYSAHIKAD